MQASCSIYLLKPVLTDPRFDGFIVAPGASSVLGNKRAYQDFKVDDAESLNWQPKSLKSVWHPLPVVGPVNAFNDYPCLELTKPVFSRRAVDALGEMLLGNGELLPLRTEIGEYYAYICLTRLDALDVKKSRLRRTGPDRTALWIHYFSFKKTKLVGASIFRIPEHPNFYLVTDQFKDRVEQAGLNGFNFVKVWPLPADCDWRMEESKRQKASQSIKLVGQALVLCFRIASQEPSVQEQKLAAAIEESLSKQLRVSSLEDKYWGSIDMDEFGNGEWRVSCTCPDCDALAGHLAEWLAQVPWEHEVAIIKRYGNLYDAKAKEVRLSIRPAGDTH